ncbi:MAG: GIY-YIG nuclease family protein, partial [Candidatus Acidiferrales bacterium]
MPAFVYVLRSERTGKRYVGSTKNLPNRTNQHNRGKVRATRSGRPWRVVHTETFE